MDTILMFKQAAAALQQDESYLRLAEARGWNDGDEALQEMIGSFNLIRMEMNAEAKKQPRDEAKLTRLTTRINELYGDVMAHPGMMAYNIAKEDMKGIINHINAIISAAVDGGDPMTVEPPQEGCGEGACDSCAGCG